MLFKLWVIASSEIYLVGHKDVRVYRMLNIGVMNLLSVTYAWICIYWVRL